MTNIEPVNQTNTDPKGTNVSTENDLNSGNNHVEPVIQTISATQDTDATGLKTNPANNHVDQVIETVTEAKSANEEAENGLKCNPANNHGDKENVLIDLEQNVRQLEINGSLETNMGKLQEGIKIRLIFTRCSINFGIIFGANLKPPIDDFFIDKIMNTR